MLHQVGPPNQQNTFVVLSVIVAGLALPYPCQAESLLTEKHFVLSAQNLAFEVTNGWYPTIGGALLIGDSIFVSNSSGILYRGVEDSVWQKLVACSTKGTNWWSDCQKALNSNAIFAPSQLWLPAAQGRDMATMYVFDRWVGSTYTVTDRHRRPATVSKWNVQTGEAYVTSVCPTGDVVFYGVVGEPRKGVVASASYDEDNIEVVFRCSSSLEEKLSSVGAKPFCIPAYNPRNNGLWVAFLFYDYVYIVDWQGIIRDSIEIAASDFGAPTRGPVSRVKSDAVFEEWLSRCTPVSSLLYIEPGYFVLQYRSGWRSCCADSFSTQTTLAWNVKGEPLPLDVSKTWLLIGVQGNNRIMFGEYLVRQNRFDSSVIYISKLVE